MLVTTRPKNHTDMHYAFFTIANLSTIRTDT